jgi:hypothetical protein
MQTEPSSEAMLELFERQDEMLGRMVDEWRGSDDPIAPWKVVPAGKLLRLWREAATLGFVRDEAAVERIADRLVENVLRIAVNNVISGHCTSSPEDAMDEHLPPEEQEAFVDWAIGTETGGWRISDYGISALFHLAALLSETHDPMEKIVVMDRMLNVSHPRSDLASWLVEGGTRTLDELAVRPADVEERERAYAR